MDIRDVTSPTPQITDGSHLNEIFKLQKQLLEGYIKVEGLPPYPFNVNSKADQLNIKDFVGRVIEELGEAYQSYLRMLNTWEGKEDEDYIPNLSNFNEELADALHFFMEILIYCNIAPEDIGAFYLGLLKKENLVDAYWYGGQDILLTSMQYARHKNSHNGLYTKDYRMEFMVIKDEVLLDEFLRGGRRVGPLNTQMIALTMWGITYRLSLARNFLKNKPWKQTQMMTDMLKFQEEIMYAWIELMNLFDFVGMTPESIFTIYFKKNQINQFRLASKY